MCGITAIISRESFDVKKDLLGCLKRLEYRGYDSAGLATFEGSLYRAVGEIKVLDRKVPSSLTSTIAIAHTRWATHGRVTEENAHPHSDDEGNVFVVHNGIIENANDLKARLIDKGCTFTSQTDSEVIAHYISHYSKTYPLHKVIQRFMAEVRGTFAICAFIRGDERLFCMRRDSPLVLGITPGRLYIASDIYAFCNRTDQVLFFEDDEYAIMDKQAFSFYNQKGRLLRKRPQTIEIPHVTVTKETYPHYMLKEIKEQPQAVARLISSFSTTQGKRLTRFVEEIRRARRVLFLSCGTSYHASLVGVSLLRQQGIDAHAQIASEVDTTMVGKGTLVIPISQSGETMDVVMAVKEARARGSRVAALVNVPHSTIQRMSDISLETLAGPEICVASTKVYTNQLVALMTVSHAFGDGDQLALIPRELEKTIEAYEPLIRRQAKKLVDVDHIFVLGRGVSYPVACEIALKLKEISYIHAEGMMGGELKHGTIALIEPGVPVISLIEGDNPDMLSNTQEVEARGGDVTRISDSEGDYVVNTKRSGHFAIHATVLGHLLSYYIARERKLPIDKPRNLAKSVTVR